MISNQETSILNEIYRYKNILEKIVLTLLEEFNNKFILLKPGDCSINDEYLYLVLIKIKEYLLYDYSKINSIEKICSIKNYLSWFNSILPLRKNKKGNYKLPKQNYPPEISL